LLHLLTAGCGTQEPRRVRPGESGYWGAADVWLRDWMALIRGF
jgi:hypothetical protein